MLCSQCLNKLVNKLTPKDIYVLYDLKSTTPQSGETRSEINERLHENMSIFQLAQSLMRVELLGLVDELKSGKIIYYFITSEGKEILNILSKK